MVAVNERLFVIDRVLALQRGRAFTDYEKCEPINRGPAPSCPSCGRHLGMLSWLPPHRVTVNVDRPLYTAIAYGGDLLVSKPLMDAFMVRGLSGLTGFDPVDVIRRRRLTRSAKTAGDPPPYFRVDVAQGPARVDWKASHFLCSPWQPTSRPRHADCSLCNSRDLNYHGVQRLVLEQGTWDGKDIFVPLGVGATYILSDRFRVLCEELQPGVMDFIPLEDYAYDPFEAKESSVTH